MPKIVRVEYDPDAPAPPPLAVTVAECEAAFVEAEAARQEVRAKRYVIRQTLPKVEMRAALAEGDNEYQAAIDAAEAANKAWARAMKLEAGTPDGPPQVVEVGAASEGEVVNG